MNMKEWIKKEILQSVTMWVGTLLLIAATATLIIGKIDGTAYLGFLAIDATIMLAKRAATQAIVGSPSPNGEGK